MPEEALRPAWQRPDPERLMAMLRDMKLNPEQIAAATSDPEHPKMIRAGQLPPPPPLLSTLACSLMDEIRRHSSCHLQSSYLGNVCKPVAAL